jgi:NADPH:quinone reductase-like Zn-dependent oxidoreductase
MEASLESEFNRPVETRLHDFVAPRPGHWVIQNAANSGVGHCLIRLAREAA